MSTVLCWPKFNELSRLLETPIELVQFLRAEVKEAEFVEDEEVRWCYLRVASFLEDGWEATRRFTPLKPDLPFDPDTFGSLVNRVVSGSRFTQRRADMAGARWLGEGSWPTRADAAAFLYFVCSEHSK